MSVGPSESCQSSASRVSMATPGLKMVGGQRGRSLSSTWSLPDADIPEVLGDMDCRDPTGENPVLVSGSENLGSMLR